MNRERLLSLDVLRGITMMLMVLVNNPGSLNDIFPPLKFATWNGCTPADLVFPFFIFIMGAAIPLSMVNQTIDGDNSLKLLSRTLRIISLGLFLSFFSHIKLFDLAGIYLLLVKIIITAMVAYLLLANFISEIKLIIALLIFILLLYLAFGGFEQFSTVRIPGVLQRIAIVYFIATILYLTTTAKTQIITAGVLLVLYWLSMTLIPVPFWGSPNLDPGTNLAAWLDDFLLNGHLWSQTEIWDPEGILSTVSAVATGIIGAVIGQLISYEEVAKAEKMKNLTILGGAMLVGGFIWSLFFPMNKSLWTSSFAIYTAGLAILLLSLLFYFIDILEYKKWTKPFLIWGTNPMIVFLLAGIIPAFFTNIWLTDPTNIYNDITLKQYLYDYCLLPQLDDPRLASLIWAMGYVIIWFVILGVLYKTKIFIRA